MSRKNLLANITSEKLTAVNSEDISVSPPKAQSLAFARHGALGAVTRSIDDLAAKADAARDIEARLTAGDAVVELEPSSIDASFVSDRLTQDDEDFQSLVEAIKERGQDSPILVRLHPSAAGRYQVAFGHRRVRAAQVLGRQVRAVVKTLSDRELVLAQGQENSARANLSFIERALFASRLEAGGYDRETIMSALSVDKTVVSRMISVVSRLPIQIIHSIGAAPATGRDRWVELAAAFQNANSAQQTAHVTGSQIFLAATSDERFNQVLAYLEKAGGLHHQNEPTVLKSSAKGRAQYWTSADGKRIARVSASDRAFVVSIDKRAAPEFGDYLLSQMDRLYAAYADQKNRED